MLYAGIDLAADASAAAAVAQQLAADSAGISPFQAPMTSLLVLESSSEDETERLGHRIAQTLQGGDVVSLNGELGAGKTRLVRAIVTALDGEDARVNSPTFVIVQQYSARLPVYHV